MPAVLFSPMRPRVSDTGIPRHARPGARFTCSTRGAAPSHGDPVSGAGHDVCRRTLVHRDRRMSPCRAGHLDKNKSTATPTVHPPGETAVNPVAAVRMPRTCPTCGYEPTTRAEAAHQRGDLAVAWLHPKADDQGSVVVRSHCRYCEPEPPAFDVACEVCGDGPILAGTFARSAAGKGLPIPVQQWLIASGWNLTPTLLCPDHR